jgi:hypothetical protein
MAKSRLTNIFGRVTNAFSVPSRQKQELDYLNQSISINDLELRQIEIEAGKFRAF